MDLSLTTAIQDALFKPKKAVAKTLINSFHYPRRGPGMLWERVQKIIQKKGHQVLVNSDVIELRIHARRVEQIVAKNSHRFLTITGDHFISSMPLNELILKMKPSPPAQVVDAAQRLTYRDFLTVALIINHNELFPDNWIYIHSPDVQVGRIQNFKNWSREMIPDSGFGTTCIGLEYFLQ